MAILVQSATHGPNYAIEVDYRVCLCSQISLTGTEQRDVFLSQTKKYYKKDREYHFLAFQFHSYTLYLSVCLGEAVLLSTRAPARVSLEFILVLYHGLYIVGCVVRYHSVPLCVIVLHRLVPATVAEYLVF